MKRICSTQNAANKRIANIAKNAPANAGKWQLKRIGNCKRSAALAIAFVK